jgi:hypothetical protein
MSASNDAYEISARPAPGPGSEHTTDGMGRELFALFRGGVGATERGASVFPLPGEVSA